MKSMKARMRFITGAKNSGAVRETTPDEVRKLCNSLNGLYEIRRTKIASVFNLAIGF